MATAILAITCCILSVDLHVLCLHGFRHGSFSSYSKLPLGVYKYVSVCVISCEGLPFHLGCVPALCLGAESGSTFTIIDYFLWLHFSRNVFVGFFRTGATILLLCSTLLYVGQQISD